MVQGCASRPGGFHRLGGAPRGLDLGRAELPPFTDSSLASGGCIGVFRGHRGLRGSVTINAGVLPRWCGIALIVGSPPVVGILVVVSIPLGMARILPGEAVWELAGIAWIAVGYRVFRTAASRTERHVRVR